MTKICNDCGKEKTLDRFHVDRSNKDGHCRRCKSCESLRGKKRYADPEYRENKVKANRERRTGLEQRLYLLLLEEQQGVCAICKEAPTSRPLYIDHNHTSGKIRGLLCNSCNLGIGLLKDRVEVLQNAISYLMRD